MAINLAEKYGKELDQLFALESKTEPVVKGKVDFLGVNAVKIYSLETQALVDYNRTASGNRYGTPTELQDTTQTHIMTQDKSFSMVIDERNYKDQMLVKEAGKVLKLQIAEQVTPLVDTYRLAKLAANAGKTDTTTATAANAYELFLSATATLGENKVPVTGRYAFVSFDYYNKLKSGGKIILASDLGMKKVENGIIGEVDGVKIIPVPTSYLPEKVQFIMAYEKCAAAPKKIETFKILKDVQGFNGSVIEGRVYFDCFVFQKKKGGIYVCMGA